MRCVLWCVDVEEDRCEGEGEGEWEWVGDGMCLGFECEGCGAAEEE